MTAIIVPERKWKPRGVGMDGQRYRFWGVELVLTPPDVGVWWGGTGDGEAGTCTLVMSKLELPLWGSERIQQV